METAMIKFALPLLAIVAAAPVAAQTQAVPLAFERDGIRYEANVVTDDGVTRITGKELGSGRTFDLKLINGKVIGRYDRTDVRYNAPTARVD
jgi:hypothetical protein